MKCTIPGNQVKVFARAIHSLSKIGEELYFEPLEHGLALRTVNSSRSAYACYVFSPTFFLHYDDGSGEITSQESDEDMFKCKITMKSCLTVFRSLSTLEKTVERCRIFLSIAESRLVFQLHCRHGIVKTHNLTFIECETLQAVFSKDVCPNSLTAHSKLLNDAVSNFQSNQEEVTLIVSNEKISLKNYTDDEPDPTKVMQTLLNLDPEEFSMYRVETESEVTFCLKELRAILAFSEAITLPVSLHFETAGKPMVFNIEGDKFEANFVLATLADATSQLTSQAPSQSTAKQKTKSQSQRKAQRSQAPALDTPLVNGHSKPKPGTTQPSERAPVPPCPPDDYDEFMDEDMDEMLNEALTQNESMAVQESNPAQYQPHGRGVNPDVRGDNLNLRGDNHDIHGHHEMGDSHIHTSQEASTSAESPVIPNQNINIQHLRADDVGPDKSIMQDVMEEEEDVVPGTPPSKKFKSMFFGLSQGSTQSQRSLDAKSKVNVLVQDSDSD